MTAAHSRPLRIALIRQRYNPFGGAERFMERAIQSLQTSNLTLTLVTRRWQQTAETSSSTLQQLVCDPFYIGSVWRNWSFARRVCRTLMHESFDLVQSHERLPCCDIYRAGDGVHREWLKQRQRILGFWGKLGIRISLAHHYQRYAERQLFLSPRLKQIICNSHMVKREIQHYFPLPDAKFTIIYNGVDTQSFSPQLNQQHRSTLRQQYGIEEQTTVYLYVGSGFERKGLATVLTAFAQQTQLNQQPSFLIVVGHDRRLKHYQQQAKDLNIATQVLFVGGQKDVRPFYGAADVFLLPTLYDPFPNAVLEAMACGLPVITSTKSGIAELITPHENGYVFDALDHHAIANCMTQLHDPTLRQHIGAAARKTVEPLNLENMGKQLQSLYQRLLDNHLPNAN